VGGMEMVRGARRILKKKTKQATRVWTAAEWWWAHRGQV